MYFFQMSTNAAKDLMTASLRMLLAQTLLVRTTVLVTMDTLETEGQAARLQARICYIAIAYVSTMTVFYDSLLTFLLPVEPCYN